LWAFWTVNHHGVTEQARSEFPLCRLLTVFRLLRIDSTDWTVGRCAPHIRKSIFEPDS
jgi:hypothetical protein